MLVVGLFLFSLIGVGHSGDADWSWSGNSVRQVSQSMCGNSYTLSGETEYNPVILSYNGTYLEGPCIINMNIDMFRTLSGYSTICLQLKSANNIFECKDVLKFYFSSYPANSSEKFYSCPDISNIVCDKANHGFAYAEITSLPTSSFDIKIFTKTQEFRTRKPTDWSGWSDLPYWPAVNRQSDMSDRYIPSYPDLSNGNTQDSTTGASVGTTLFVFIVIIVCFSKWRWQKNNRHTVTRSNNGRNDEGRVEDQMVSSEPPQYSTTVTEVRSPEVAEGSSSDIELIEINTENRPTSKHETEGNDVCSYLPPYSEPSVTTPALSQQEVSMVTEVPPPSYTSLFGNE